MNANKLTNIFLIIGTVLLVAALVAGNIWGGRLWIGLIWVAGILILSRTAYEMIHFREYKQKNINFLVSIPVILIALWIMNYFHVI